MLTALTEQEAETVQMMLQRYREFEEDLYGYPEDETLLFTERQLRVFQLFDVISIKNHK